MHIAVYTKMRRSLHIFMGILTHVIYWDDASYTGDTPVVALMLKCNFKTPLAITVPIPVPRYRPGLRGGH